ncbi:MAG TPA: helicase, partial [Methyloceanibacter sp.]|nr:helicase [Methyloceanibacter sp.]
IAGRAGRHMNDGTFGVTGQVPAFESELIDRLENHSFDQVGMLQWRNRKLDFGSIESLKESLRETPDHPRLIRSRMVDDVIALENVSHDAGVRELASGRAGVALLWEMCQIPDYRKISAASHAELVGTLYRFVMSDEGRIPADWFARQVALADRTDGDLDTLSNRLAQIRTWTFVSHRAQWLDDPEHWQGRTRAIEDMLSDALHERLTHRFVDKRTSVLMRRLRDKEELVAEIGADGQVIVEDHYVGSLDGFRFTPDTSSDGIHGRAARHAAVKVLAHELGARAAALSAASDADIVLKPNGRIAWRSSEIARLERGDGPLKPKIQLLADEHLGAAEREQVQRRIEAWLSAQLNTKLEPLVALSEASDLSGLARGLAFRVVETLGVLRRDAVAGEIKALDQPARAGLRKYGVRFGAFNIYIPALLKPAAADLLLLLWALHAGRDYGIDAEALPPRPQHGLTSVEVDPHVPEPYWHAAGFQIAGARAIRIDMLERLSDLIRARVSWRPVEGGEPAPSGATGDGGFRVAPELISVVGCSGEDFASILKALGFRRERRKLKPADVRPSEVAHDGNGPEATAETSEPAPQPDLAFDEIWRPGKRNEGRKPQIDQAKGKPRRGVRQGQAPRQREQRPHLERKERPRASHSSPFAVLAELRRNLAARRPEGS